MKSNFGAFIRERRLAAELGLRRFAEMIGMLPSNLSNIEHGRLNPPQDPEMLKRIANALDMQRGTANWARLHDLAVAHKDAALAPDVAQYAARAPGVPLLLRTIADRRLTEAELEKLAEYIESQYAEPSDGSR